MSAKNGKRAHGHRFTADEKVKVLEEARQPGTTVAEVLRRYQIDGTTFYRWEKEAKAAVRDALGGKPRGGDARTRELLSANAKPANRWRLHQRGVRPPHLTRHFGLIVLAARVRLASARRPYPRGSAGCGRSAGTSLARNRAGHALASTKHPSVAQECTRCACRAIRHYFNDEAHCDVLSPCERAWGKRLPPEALFRKSFCLRAHEGVPTGGRVRGATHAGQLSFLSGDRRLLLLSASNYRHAEVA